ncbi:MAG: SEL1-like repeat protein [Endomicrobia bacterium]|nr:SEL1-like repeat protein [Endomicrobiia bacterium]
MKKVLLMFLATAVFCVSASFAANFEETKKKAEQGDKRAQYDLGFMYYHGKDVGRDLDKAIYWLEKLDSPYTQNYLGKIYLEKKDLKKAIYWYEKTAEKGSYESQHSLLMIYLEKQDLEKVMYWYEKLAKHGVAAHGDIAQDLKKARNWIEKLAEQGNREAQLYAEGIESGKFDGIETQLKLGTMYFFEKRDLDKAIYWLRQAVEQRDARGGTRNDSRILDAMYYLGEAYQENKDLEKAIYWIEKAAEQGNTNAQIRLLTMYLEKQDLEGAIYWLEILAVQDIMGVHVYAEQNFKKVMYQYERMAKQGDGNAQYILGKIYHFGVCVEKDFKKAKYWLKKAAKQGNAKAKEMLKESKKL